MAALLQYLIEKDEWEKQEKARSESDRLKLDEQRMELDREMHQKKCLQMVYQQLKTWDDSTDPEAYTDNFKLAMLEAKVPTADWVGIVCKQLAGKALAGFRELELETTTPYQDFKVTILKQLGATVEQARRTIWLTKPTVETNPEYVLKSTLRAINRLKAKLSTPEEASQELFRGFLMKYFSEEALMLIDSSTSGLPHDQINLVKRLWESKDFYARRKMLQLETVLNSNSSSGWRRREGGYFRDTTREGAREGAAEQLPPAKKEGDPPSSRGGVGGRSSGRGWGSQRGSWSGNRIDRNTVVCLNCHKTGHFQSECTEARVTLNRIQSPNSENEEDEIIQGSVNVYSGPMILDTGACRSAIPGRYITPFTVYRQNNKD